MNKRRLAGIARWLERGAKAKKNVVKFDMSNGVMFQGPHDATLEDKFSCGTACCIAGAAVMFYNKPLELARESYAYAGISWTSVRAEAYKLLDLDSDRGYQLFYGIGGIGACSSVSPAWAARVIRKLIATGEVDWAGTREEPK